MRTREEVDAKLWETKSEWGQTFLLRGRILELEDEVRRLRDSVNHYRGLSNVLLTAISSQPFAGGRHPPPDTQKAASQ